MTVKELIEELKEYPEDMEVCLAEYDSLLDTHIPCTPDPWKVKIHRVGEDTVLFCYSHRCDVKGCEEVLQL